jgi:predicted ester cyclase
MQKETTLTWRWFDQVWKNGNEQAIDEMMAVDATVHGIEGITEKGPSGFKLFHRDFLKNFNVHVDVLDVISENGIETSRCEVNATHKQSGRDVKFSGHTTIKIEYGKIAEGWNNFDFLSMYQQLGFSLRSATPQTN